MKRYCCLTFKCNVDLTCNCKISLGLTLGLTHKCNFKCKPGLTLGLTHKCNFNFNLGATLTIT